MARENMESSVLSAVRQSERRGATIEELLAATGLSESTLRTHLRALVKRGTVIKANMPRIGKVGRPARLYHYREYAR